MKNILLVLSWEYELFKLVEEEKHVNRNCVRDRNYDFVRSTSLPTMPLTHLIGFINVLFVLYTWNII